MLKRLTISLAAVGAAAAFGFAQPATAASATTLPPTALGGGAVLLHGFVNLPCDAYGFFTIQQVPGGPVQDSFFTLGNPDQHVGAGGGTYTEGPFNLKPDADYAVQAHGNCSPGSSSVVDGNVLIFHTGVSTAVPVDVAVAQSLSSGAKAGAPATITVTGTNLGKNAASDSVVKDFLPAGFQYIACALKDAKGNDIGECSWDGKTTVTGDIGAIAGGASVTLSIGVLPTLSGSFANTVGIGAHEYDPDWSNNFVTQALTVG